MLSLCFIIQFAIACSCLFLISANSRDDVLKAGWDRLSEENRREVQIKYNCCGFNNSTAKLNNCPKTADRPCLETIKSSVDNALKITGIVGLVFSFSDVND